MTKPVSVNSLLSVFHRVFRSVFRSSPLRTTLIGACLLIAAPSPAHANCAAQDLTISVPFPVRQLNSPTNPSVDITVKRKKQSTDCNFWIGFSKGQSSTYDRKLLSASNELDYDIFKTPSSPPLVLKSYPEAVSLGEVYTGRFIKGGGSPSQQTFTSYPQMIAPLPGPFHILPPGAYSDTVQIRLFNGVFPPTTAPVEIASVSQSYVFGVLPFAIVSLLDTGLPYTNPPIAMKTLNFGTLTSGESMSFDLVLLYNSGYRVTFNSQYGARMKHDTQEYYVPYTMTINGVDTTLNAGQGVVVSSGNGVSPSAPTGHRLPVAVTIGSTTGMLAGPYGDSITIEVTSI
ncbi:MAG: hypothetical protein NDI61_12015 [Bdellovibrionaceae bacterium]|nr:hypothetical protein [Pseudobdellovibrionaceae bacterium]